MLLTAYTRIHVTTRLCPTFHDNTNFRSALHTVVDKSHLVCFDFGFRPLFLTVSSAYWFKMTGEKAFLSNNVVNAFTFTLIPSMLPPCCYGKQLYFWQELLRTAWVQEANFHLSKWGNQSKVLPAVRFKLALLLETTVILLQLTLKAYTSKPPNHMPVGGT